MKMIKIFIPILLIALVLHLTSCSEDENEITPTIVEEVSPLPTFDSYVQTSADEIVFGDFATGINGGAIQAATVAGMLDDAHATFIRIPVGDETIPHTHSHIYQGVVIKGIIENPVEGDLNPKQLPAGSFWYQPGEQGHITRCSDESTEPCLIYLYQVDNFDFIPE